MMETLSGMNKFIVKNTYEVTNIFEYVKDENNKCYVIKKEWQRIDVWEQITEEEYNTKCLQYCKSSFSS